jgi:hypothetical protein
MCRRELPVEVFAGLHKRCNRCRTYRMDALPTSVRKRGYVMRKKSQPCKRCGQSFLPAAMQLVHVRDTKLFSVASQWRWMSEDQVTDELKKVEPMCLNCCGIERAEKRQAEAAQRRDLAVSQRALTSAPGISA